MSEQIVLFDLPSREPRSCWSLNPWKTRMLLNYKGLDYRTEWVEYPDIQPTFSPHLPPNKTTITPYSIPTIRLPSGTYVSDSRVIATTLEQARPSPPLHLDSPQLARLEELMRAIMLGLRSVYIPLVPRRLLNDASLPHWYRTRAEWIGMPVDEFERAHPAAEGWAAAEGFLKEVTGLLKAADGKGPFFLGGEVSYADFVWGGFLVFLGRIGKDVVEEGLRRCGDREVHEALLRGLGPWTERCDY
ncbi:hypothetical protein N658DRAFT_527464 [Parathielavia hyrcaniae]|uniref:GST N-terminal domain-containing protein n=1 Tax=Parathielavia hyrcaniae TaxID=113614 RepID=A0AAN6PWI2_9PEZI|nr:hypothetical protein N658DRAFT_527464 [Parathielavia hyrcaniae]